MQILISRISYHINDKGEVTKYRQQSRERTIVVQGMQKKGTMQSETPSPLCSPK